MKRLLLALLCFAAALSAQSVTGTLVGTVSDATGVVPNVPIVITNQGTDAVWNTKSNERGDYSVPNLPAGTYRIRAEFAGYRSVLIENITLLINRTERHDIHLVPGEVKQAVEVTATAPVVQSETSSLSSVIDTHSLEALPTNGRTLDTFLLTTAGNAGDSASNPKIGGSQHWGGTVFTVNGVTFNDLGNGGGAYSYTTALATQPSLETIQEFKVESNSAKAEYGGSVAVSLLTKGGTNQFHGSLFEFNRNRELAANQFFSNSAGKAKPPYNRNEFGASLGGPIVRRHTFFFVSYEGLRLRNSNPGTFSVPINAIRQGDFTGYSAIKDPLAGAAFANNQIPASRIDTRSAKILTFVPQPNLAGKTYNYAETMANRIGINRASARVDHTFNSTNMLSASLTYGKGDPYSVNQYSPMAYGNYSNAGFLTKSANLTYTRILSPTQTNELRASYFAMENIRIGQNTDFNPASLFPTLFTPLPMGGLPTFNITGFTKVGDYGGAKPNPQITNQFGDTFSWVHGSHVTKAGIDLALSRVSTNPSVTAAALGTFGFNTRYTANAFSDFLLGYPYTATRATATPANVIGQQRWGAFIQDDWQISPHFTLNVGLRYELQTQLSERSGSWTNFDMASGSLVVRTVNGNYPSTANQTMLGLYPVVKSENIGWGSDVILPDHKNFAPRIGFAFRPFRDDKTVIRGGYGIFYNLIPIYQGVYQLGISNSPFRLVQSFSGGATAPTISLSDPFSVSPTVSANPVLYAMPRQIRNPYSQQWNLTLERQLPGQVGMRLSYVGNKVNRGIFVNYNLNQPVTQRAGELQAMRPYQPWGDVYAMMLTGNAFTNQMQVEATRRFRSGLFFQSSFTWTRTLDNMGITGSPQNPYNASADRGNADGIRPLTFSTNAAYELPFGPGKYFNVSSPVLGKVVGGWRLAGVARFNSGSPFSITFSPALSGWYANRADVVSNNFYPANKSIAQWFNGSAFATPASYTFGNSSRNMLFGPSQKIIDLSLSKTTSVNDRISTEFRLDAFNLPNTPSFGNPASNLTVPSTVGVITSTTVDARTVQIGLKVRF
jgi:hypothetical protein